MVAVVLTTAAIAVPGGCHDRMCVERVAARWCQDRGSVVSCIHRGALRWRVSYRMLRRKAWCESRFDPRASNGTHFGLFQFATSTWASTPYAKRSVWRAKWASLAAAWMHKVGRANEWACR